MSNYNCIVSVYQKVGDNKIPLTKFTMYMESVAEVANKVVEWALERWEWDDLEDIVFRYEMVEQNTEEWQGE
jgi:hypothetical protein